MASNLWLLAPLLLITKPSLAQLEARFPAPPGFVRQTVGPGTFAHYLRHVPLQPAGSPVLWHNGSPKPRQDIHAAVLDISVGSKDLQQCADAVMRLRAEHLFAEGHYDDIHFNFTNGFRAEYGRWRKGERIVVNGNACTWKAGATAKNDRTVLLDYLQKVFTYAGTLSLSKELKSATDAPLQGGDVFIRGGSPGHAMLVLDVAVHADGRQAFLLAQSYMPAQSIHVVKNLHRPELGSWFILEDGAQLQTPEWTFDWQERKRW